MRRLFMILTALAVAVSADAQVRTNVSNGPTLPAACNTGDVFVKTGASAGLYHCIDGTWHADGGGGGSLDLTTITNGSLLYDNADTLGGVGNWDGSRLIQPGGTNFGGTAAEWTSNLANGWTTQNGLITHGWSTMQGYHDDGNNPSPSLWFFKFGGSFASPTGLVLSGDNEQVGSLSSYVSRDGGFSDYSQATALEFYATDHGSNSGDSASGAIWLKAFHRDGDTDSGAQVKLNGKDNEITFQAHVPDVDGSGFVPTLAGAGVGLVPNGTHRYLFMFMDYADKHTGSASAVATPAVTVVNNAVNGKVTVPIPYSNCNSHFPRTMVYRDKNNDGVFKFAFDSDWSCQSEWEDNLADGDLGAVAPTDNTASTTVSLSGGGVLTTTFDANTWGGPAVFLDGGSANNFSFQGLNSVDVTIGAGSAAPSMDGDSIGGGNITFYSGNATGGASPGGIRLFGGDPFGVGLIGGEAWIRGGQAHAGATGGAVTLEGGGDADGMSSGGDVNIVGGGGHDAASHGRVLVRSGGQTRILVNGTGTVDISSLTTTGAATGKKVVCVDTNNGRLYASNSSTDCSN